MKHMRRKVFVHVAGVAILVVVVGAFLKVQAALRSDPVATRAEEIQRLVSFELPRTDAAASRVRGDGRRAALNRAAQLRWFTSNPLGLFVHFGPQAEFAAPSQSRWFTDLEKLVAATTNTKVATYAPDPSATNTWIAAAKAAGASYLTITAKHHDGLCLWASDVTTWDVDPRHDLLKRVATEARNAGLRLFIYYSLVDFHEATYGRDVAAYAAFVRAQMRELLTRYGPIAGLWFDLPRYSDGLSRRQLTSLYALIHRLQPWALIGANHHGEVLRGEDFRIFEESFPRADRRMPVAMPRQAIYRLGRTWFWSGKAEPTGGERLRRLRAEARQHRVGLLVDVAPRPDGRIPASVRRALRAGASAGTR